MTQPQSLALCGLLSGNEWTSIDCAGLAAVAQLVEHFTRNEALSSAGVSYATLR